MKDLPVHDSTDKMARGRGTTGKKSNRLAKFPERENRLVGVYLVALVILVVSLAEQARRGRGNAGGMPLSVAPVMWRPFHALSVLAPLCFSLRTFVGPAAFSAAI
jgi:hypothetical protein